MSMELEPSRIGEALASEAYVQVRRRMFRQLLESLIFEGLVTSEQTQIGHAVLYTLHGAGCAGQPVAYRCEGRVRLSFGRIRLSRRPVERISEAETKEAESLELLMLELFRGSGVSPAKLRAFIEELEQTLLKDTLAQYERSQDRQLAAAAGTAAVAVAATAATATAATATAATATTATATAALTDTAVAAATAISALTATAAPAAAPATAALTDSGGERLEAGLAGGHPYHPSYKSRIGFDIADNYAYGPEYRQPLQPVWLAAHRSGASAYAAPGRAFRDMLADELGEELLLRFDAVVRSQGADPAQYVYIPVHPWQWRRQVVAKYAAELHDRRLIVLGCSEDRYTPQQSIRTLSNATSPGQAYLKLSLSIQNTSSMRHLSFHSIASAPLISEWLAEVVAGDPYLHQEARLILLKEYAGAYYEPDKSASEEKRSPYGEIGCIWRESLQPQLDPGEESAPFHALCAWETPDQPFIDPWLRSAGIEAWLKQLLGTCVIPVVHLLTAHGIVLESHAQNMVLVHRQGVPVRVALKDFHEGVEFCRAFLPDPARRPAFETAHPYYATGGVNDFFEMEHVGQLREMMLDALFHMNLGELACLLEEQYGFSEASFWRLAADALDAYALRHPELKERFERLDLFAPTCGLEQLTKRRLYADCEQLTHEAPNPLHAARRKPL